MFAFLIEQEESIKGQLARKVLEKTAREYQLEWDKLWVPFIARLSSCESSIDVFVRSAENDDIRVKVICLFIASRYNKGLRGTHVTGVLGAIRHIFVVMGICTRFMDDNKVSAGRKGCILRAADLRKKRESHKEHSALYNTQETLTTIRESYWEGLNWSTACDLDKRAAYLGNDLSFDMALRVGSYTRKEPRREDHCIKSQDWCFILLPKGITDENETKERVVLKVGEELKTIDVGRVVALDLMQVSVKGGENHSVKSIGRRSPSESQLLDDMVACAQKSCLMSGEDFSTRRTLDKRGNVISRSLLAKDVITAKRLAAESLGLSGRFNLTHGNRKGGISQMASCGVERRDLLNRFNHSAQSSTSERVYQYQMSGPGALAVGGLRVGNAPLSVADCRRIDAASSGLLPISSCPGTTELGGREVNPFRFSELGS